MVQNNHLQEAPPVTINPPTRGPSAGPPNGASVKRARALPRVRASQISDIMALEGNASTWLHSEYWIQNVPGVGQRSGGKGAT